MTDRYIDAMRVRIRPGIENNKEANGDTRKCFDSYIETMRVRLLPHSENSKEADGGIQNYFDRYIDAMGVRSRPNYRAPGSAMAFTLQ